MYTLGSEFLPCGGENGLAQYYTGFKDMESHQNHDKSSVGMSLLTTERKRRSVVQPPTVIGQPYKPWEFPTACETAARMSFQKSR